MAVKYFYVKSGGSLGINDETPWYVGGGETPETGLGESFADLTAAKYYDSIAAACGDGTKSSPASDGDFVLVSDQHSQAHDFGISPEINESGAQNPAQGLQIISVDDTDTSVYKPGGSEELNDVSDNFIFNRTGLIAGITLKTADTVFNIGLVNSTWQIQDCVLNVSNGTADMAVTSTKDGGKVILRNTDINFTGAGNVLCQIGGGSVLEIHGGAVSGTAPNNLIESASGDGGGAQIWLNGVDLSAMSGTIWEGPSTWRDSILVKLTNCRLHDSLTALYGTLAMSYHRFEMYNCDDSTDKYYRFEVADGTGSAKNNDSVYVTATEAWYGGSDKSSIQVDTESYCSRTQPFVFELPTQYIDLASGSTDVLTIDMATAETLVKQDMAAFLVYPDGTTSIIPNWVSSGPSASGYIGIDPMDSSTAMPSSSLGAGDWTSEPGSPNFYKMTLDTSGDAGQAAAVSVRIEVYKASIGPIYIHPLFTLS